MSWLLPYVTGALISAFLISRLFYFLLPRRVTGAGRILTVYTLVMIVVVGLSWWGTYDETDPQRFLQGVGTILLIHVPSVLVWLIADLARAVRTPARFDKRPKSTPSAS